MIIERKGGGGGGGGGPSFDGDLAGNELRDSTGSVVVQGDFANPVIIRQIGGTGGVDDLELVHNGARSELKSRSGGLGLYSAASAFEADLGVSPNDCVRYVRAFNSFYPTANNVISLGLPGFGVFKDLNLSGQANLGAANASSPSLNIPHGSAPSMPNNGDMWTTSAGLFIHINGSTVGPLS